MGNHTMRHYSWYSPEIDVIVLQIIMEDCYISFEWGMMDMYENLDYDAGIGIDSYLWIPLGEV